jgi:hypothetical protein
MATAPPPERPYSSASAHYPPTVTSSYHVSSAVVPPAPLTGSHWPPNPAQYGAVAMDDGGLLSMRGYVAMCVDGGRGGAYGKLFAGAGMPETFGCGRYDSMPSATPRPSTLPIPESYHYPPPDPHVNPYLPQPNVSGMPAPANSLPGVADGML